MFARILILVVASVLVWSIAARSSQAHGAKQVVTVKPYDTLWSIAERHYGGDVRDAIWRIEQANHLHGAALQVGERLVLP
ncbi:MAG TPA: LysM peptidoglycan-binding domain-containing protein [Gaiellaceae bacterium]|nr:LysM peptidoglycan-binding domain-containing protein [Gaiellaceae bacterium]